MTSTRRRTRGRENDHLACLLWVLGQAGIIYEDELTDSKVQLRALISMVGTLLSCRSLPGPDYDTLITKTTQYGAKLLKKPDQCRVVTLCSHLFWAGTEVCEPPVPFPPLAFVTRPWCGSHGLLVRVCARVGGVVQEDEVRCQPRRVLECLQRSLKIADACMSSTPMHVHLFIEILDQYLYYFENDNPQITDKYISGLIALINTHIENMESSNQRSEVEAHYRNTKEHIRGLQANPKTAAKFQPIVLGA